MKVDPQITFEGIAPSDAISARIADEIEKLERFFGRITACRVVVTRPQKRHHHGDLYAVAVQLTLPNGRDVYADRNPPAAHAHEDVYVAIRDVFKAARRKLQDEARKLRGDVKHHAAPLEAIVATLVAEKNYGFLEVGDGSEIYFHRNSVANDGFDRLKIGERVTYAEAEGDQGPQATFVRPM
jgi:cold shock CspA family protein